MAVSIIVLSFDTDAFRSKVDAPTGWVGAVHANFLVISIARNHVPWC